MSLNLLNQQIQTRLSAQNKNENSATSSSPSQFKVVSHKQKKKPPSVTQQASNGSEPLHSTEKPLPRFTSNNSSTTEALTSSSMSWSSLVANPASSAAHDVDDNAQSHSNASAAAPSSHSSTLSSSPAKTPGPPRVVSDSRVKENVPQQSQAPEQYTGLPVQIRDVQSLLPNNLPPLEVRVLIFHSLLNFQKLSKIEAQELEDKKRFEEFYRFYESCQVEVLLALLCLSFSLMFSRNRTLSSVLIMYLKKLNQSKPS